MKIHISRILRWLLRLDQLRLDVLADESVAKNREALQKQQKAWAERSGQQQFSNSNA